jgi:hypothetical protein
MTDKRTNDEIRADVIVSHFLGTDVVPTIPDALRLSEQIARGFAAVRADVYRECASGEAEEKLRANIAGALARRAAQKRWTWGDLADAALTVVPTNRCLVHDPHPATATNARCDDALLDDDEAPT